MATRSSTPQIIITEDPDKIITTVQVATDRVVPAPTTKEEGVPPTEETHGEEVGTGADPGVLPAEAVETAPTLAAIMTTAVTTETAGTVPAPHPQTPGIEIITVVWSSNNSNNNSTITAETAELTNRTTEAPGRADVAAEAETQTPDAVVIVIEEVTTANDPPNNNEKTIGEATAWTITEETGIWAAGQQMVAETESSAEVDLREVIEEAVEEIGTMTVGGVDVEEGEIAGIEVTEEERGWKCQGR